MTTTPHTKQWISTTPVELLKFTIASATVVALHYGVGLPWNVFATLGVFAVVYWLIDIVQS